MECMCAQTRLILSSERIGGRGGGRGERGNGVRTHVNAKGKNPLDQGLREGPNLRHCITQDSEPNTLPTELFWPLVTDEVLNSFLMTTGKSSSMIGALLCDFGSCERHSKITEET